jgi:hypothetical protein
MGINNHYFMLISSLKPLVLFAFLQTLNGYDLKTYCLIPIFQKKYIKMKPLLCTIDPCCIYVYGKFRELKTTKLVIIKH